MLKSILLHTLSSHNLVHMLCWFAGNLSLYHLAITLPPITTSPVDGVKLIWFYNSLQDSLYGLMIADLQSAWNQWLSRNVTCDLLPCVIQIKICAKYRDMLPRPRLVCQEPGLRPIGQSPGVPDKSSRGLGSMSRYSAQILICFIAYIFLIFFIPLWVWLGTLHDCQYAQCPLPLSIVIRMRLVIRQSKLPVCLAEVQLGHQNTLWHLSYSLVNMTDKMD